MTKSTLVASWPCTGSACSRTFTHRASRTSHVRSAHGGIVHPCPNAAWSKTFVSRTVASNYARAVHDNKRNYACPFAGCSAAFAYPGYVPKHVSAVHEKARDYGCRTCGRKFALKTNLERHAKRGHKRRWRLVCEVAGCGVGFPDCASEKLHIRTVHDGRRDFACDKTCGMRFSSRPKMLRHVQSVREGRRDFECEVLGCGKKFADKTTLVNHALVHEGRFKCDVAGCEVSFKLKGAKTKHVRVVHGPGSGSRCDVEGSGEMFSYRGYLTRHAWAVLGEGSEFACLEEGCGKDFASDFTLRIHAAMHVQAEKVVSIGSRVAKTRRRPLHRSGQAGTSVAEVSRGESVRKELLCEVGCWKLFASNADLVRHVQEVHVFCGFRVAGKRQQISLSDSEGSADFVPRRAAPLDSESDSEFYPSPKFFSASNRSQPSSSPGAFVSGVANVERTLKFGSAGSVPCISAVLDSESDSEYYPSPKIPSSPDRSHPALSLGAFALGTVNCDRSSRYKKRLTRAVY